MGYASEERTQVLERMSDGKSEDGMGWDGTEKESEREREGE